MVKYVCYIPVGGTSVLRAAISIFPTELGTIEEDRSKEGKKKKKAVIKHVQYILIVYYSSSMVHIV
jgi:hypothetical protein